jgi:hypothetical protein
MQDKLNKKKIALDLALIILVTTGIVFGATWIYSEILTITGTEPVIVLTSDAGANPMVDKPFMLTATLTLKDIPLSGETVTFFEDNLPIGTAITNFAGNASLVWTVKAGSHDYKAGYQVV